MRALLLLLSLTLFAACSGNPSPAPDPEEEGEVSFFTGKKGGIKLADLGKPSDGGNGMPVNAILWRAALDIAALLPLEDVDTFGGSIVTEWYSLPENPDERIKLTIFILGRELRSDAIKVRVHVQRRTDTGWSSAERDEDMSRKIEDLILTRAREIRSESLPETVN